MNLRFSTKFPKGKGKLSSVETHFVEKILNCHHYDLKLGATINNFLDYERHGYKNSYELITRIQNVKPKKHTFRRDSKNQWKQGNSIHYWIDARTKNQFQFAPIVPCTSTQNVVITYDEEICDRECIEPAIFIDDRAISMDEYTQLAINDGFDSEVEFLEWFDKDFEGKIIHWTDLKY